MKMKVVTSSVLQDYVKRNVYYNQISAKKLNQFYNCALV